MRCYLISIVFLGTSLAAFAQQREQQSLPLPLSAARPLPVARVVTNNPVTEYFSEEPDVAPTAAVTNHHITVFGNYLVDGIWNVHVSEYRVNVSPGPPGKPWSWSAQTGWFAFIENDRRVWAYDGARNLWLFECATAAKEGGPMWLMGPNGNFGHPVPERVLARLSSATRKSIQQHEQ